MKKRLYLLLATFGTAFFLTAVPVAASASPVFYTGDAKADVLTGVNDAGGSSGSPKVESIVKTVIQILSIVAGIAAVIMIIISGVKYITSGGDSGSVKSAKDTLLYAIVGVVVVIMSQGIIMFVLNKVK